MIDCKQCKHSELLYRIVGTDKIVTRGYVTSGYILCSGRHKKRGVKIMTDWKMSCGGYEEKEVQSNA